MRLQHWDGALFFFDASEGHDTRFSPFYDMLWISEEHGARPINPYQTARVCPTRNPSLIRDDDRCEVCHSIRIGLF